jgi:7,8-dihydropterin-6-yl-methyl-4-(beta-D-ribofuranosyl)aminobenzene 5'-phosphate synthase
MEMIEMALAKRSSLAIHKYIIAFVIFVALPPLIAAGGEEVQGMDGGEAVIPADSVKLTILFDNFHFFDGCETSWGYSCLIEIPEAVILFDTGEHDSILMHNMERLGIDPTKIDIVVLSHEHRDHTGGLRGFLTANRDVSVYIPSTFGAEIRGTLSKYDIDPIDVTEPVEIVPGVRSCGVMGDVIPEQSISISTDRGPIVVTGCAHPGIAEITARAKESGGRDPLLVMGGWHLRGSSGARIEAILETFAEMGVRYVAPSHCTGEEAIAAFEKAFGERFIAAGAGKIVKGRDLE